MMKSILALDFLKLVIHLKDMEDTALNTAILTYTKKQKISGVRKSSARQRRCRQRKSWQDFQSKLTDRQFRRYFRMSRNCFAYLRAKIESDAGEQTVKSKMYLTNLKDSKSAKDQSKAHAHNNLHKKPTGGFISREVKLAITLRILAGGSYLDMALLYETGESYSHLIFHDVIENWIIDDRLVKINGIDFVNDEERLEKVALQFACLSGGLLTGCIGAIDGWIVKIRKPSLRDGVSNPGSFSAGRAFLV